MCDELITGVSNPGRPDHWLVPPWAPATTFSEVVRHFLRFNPWRNADAAQLLAYYEGYEAALDAAPVDEGTYPLYERWRTEVRCAVGRCADLYREKCAGEIRRGEGGRGSVQLLAVIGGGTL